MLIEELTPEWIPSPGRPGFYQKTMKCGNATIIVNRPILEPEVQKRREAVTIRAAENYLSALERRKRMEENERKDVS